MPYQISTVSSSKLLYPTHFKKSCIAVRYMKYLILCHHIQKKIQSCIHSKTLKVEKVTATKFVDAQNAATAANPNPKSPRRSSG